jgi:hypothetical protein
MPIPPAIAGAVTEVAAGFRRAGIDLAVGGSVMLALNGIAVVPHDVDVVVEAADREAVAAILPAPTESVPRRGPWRTAWLLRTEWPVPGGGVGLDVIGGLALEIDGALARFPLIVERAVMLSGIVIPLAPLAHWYHLYRVHDPAKAGLIRPYLDPAAITAAAAELGLPGPEITLH